MKKILAIILSVAMLMSMLTVAGADAAAVKTADIIIVGATPAIPRCCLPLRRTARTICWAAPLPPMATAST